MAGFEDFASKSRAVQIDIAKEALKKSLATMKRNVDIGTRKDLYLWAAQTIGRVIAKNLSGRPGLNVVSGDLMRSLQHREKGSTLADLQTELFTRSKYAHVHEYGATIRAKPPNKYLKIPIRPSPGAQPTSWRSVEQVYIPPRLKFSKTVKEELKALQAKLIKRYRDIFERGRQH